MFVVSSSGRISHSSRPTTFSFCKQAVYHSTCTSKWKETDNLGDFKKMMTAEGRDIWKIRLDGVKFEQVESELVTWMKNAEADKRLLSLSFANAQLHDENKTISTFKQLEKLVLQNSGFTGGLLINSELRSISIVENQLTSIPFKTIEKISSLRHASFASNHIKNITNTHFQNRERSMYSLNLENNRITELPPTSLFKIFDVFLGGNKIKDFSSSAFSKVLRLELQGNLLSSLKRSMFEGLSIQYINVSGNQIQTIDQDFFLTITKDLLKIDLSRNKLTGLPVIDGALLPNLKVVQLDGNNLTRLDGVFRGEFSELKTLGVSDIGLRNISEIPFHRMPELRKLNLDNNYISGLDKHSFANNFKLKEINMETTKYTYENGVDVVERSDPVFCSCTKNPKNITLRCNTRERRSNYSSPLVSITIAIGNAVCTVSFPDRRTSVNIRFTGMKKTTTNNGVLIYVFPLFALVILVVILVAFVMVKRRRRNAENPTNEKSMGDTECKEVIVILCLSILFFLFHENLTPSVPDTRCARQRLEYFEFTFYGKIAFSGLKGLN